MAIVKYPEVSRTWESLEGKPYITVSAVGIANGLSDIPNGGADFGVDTTLGATSPSQTGAPYTQTSGIQEALNYASQIYQQNVGKTLQFIDILVKGFLNVNADIIAPTTNIQHIRIFGTGRDTSIINFNSGSRGFVLDGTTVYFFNHLEFSSYNSQSPPSYLVSYSASTPNPNQAVWFRDCVFWTDGSSTTKAFNFQNANAVYFSDCSINGPAGYFYSSGAVNPNTVFSMLRSIGTASELAIDGYDSVDLTDCYSFYLQFLGSNNKVLINGGQYFNVIQFLRAFPNGTSSSATLGYVKIQGIEFIVNTTLSSPKVIGGNPSGQQSTVNILDVGDMLYENGEGGSTSGTIYPVGLANYQPNLGSYGVVVNQKVRYGKVVSMNGLPVFNFEQLTPILTANPPVSGTVYQNTNPFDIEINLPVYATTAGTAGYVTIARGSTSTPSSLGNQFVNGSTSSTSVDIIKLKVPAGWYYSFTASGITFGTATVLPE